MSDDKHLAPPTPDSAPQQADTGPGAREPLQLDGAALKAFAHPLRTRLYAELEQAGPATSAQLAARVGDSRGSTSYHLRQLARHGLLEEVPGRGSAKERWWRTRPGGYAFNGDLLRRQPETARAAEVLIEDFVQQRSEELARWARESRAMPHEWVQASINARTVVSLTREELAELVSRVRAVVDDYRPHEPQTGQHSDSQRTDADGHRARVVVTFDALPWVEPPTQA